MAEVRYVICNGEGHYEVSLNGKTISCDEGEVDETIQELMDMVEAA